MAWNRPSEEKKAEVEERGGQRNVHLKGLVAGAIVVVGAGVAAWWLWPDASAPVRGGADGTAGKLIKEVAPAVTNAAPAVAEEKEDRNSLEWHKKHDKRYFIPPDAVRRPNGRLYTKGGLRILEDLPRRTIQANAGEKKIFDNMAEYQIARLLKIQPGQALACPVVYGQRFIESFKQSLVQPTLVLQDDDEETKALKREVNEVKADLKARMEAGEDIVQMLRDTEKELEAMSRYKVDIQQQLAAMRKDESVSEQDYADFVDAANIMLKERGLKGVSLPKITEARLKLIRERNRAKAPVGE